MFLKNFAKPIESYICRRLFFNKVGGCRLKKNPVLVYSFEFWESFKNYLVTHVRTAASDILGYLYIGISTTKFTLKKYTVFSSILLFIQFKLILESCRTSGVYLEPYQTYMMQKRSVIDIWQGSKYDSVASSFKYFSSFFVWILEWIYELFCVSSKNVQLLCSRDVIKILYDNLLVPSPLALHWPWKYQVFIYLYDRDLKMLTLKNFKMECKADIYCKWK